MFALVSHHAKYLPAGVLAFAFILLFCVNTQLHAACRGEGFMGVSTKDPIQSFVDITSLQFIQVRAHPEHWDVKIGIFHNS